MTKEKQITIKLNALTALDLLQILDSSTFGYSKEYEPERISRLRSLMSQLDQELEKFII
jgi:hypothetical protein